MKQTNLRLLPFDQYSRQIQALKVTTFFKKNQRLNILDVGGYKGVTKLLHINDNVTTLDVFDVKEDGYVKGDGLNLPFKDSQFDFVFSFDVLEHIKQDNRNRFIDEMCRVSSRGVIIAAPIKTELSTAAELLLNNLYIKLFDEEHPWLKEHIEYGLPNKDFCNNKLIKNGLNTIVLPSNEINLWLSMQYLIFVGAKHPEISESIENINKIYNQFGPFDGDENIDNNYRQIVVGLKKSEDKVKLKNWLNNQDITISNKNKLFIEGHIGEEYLKIIRKLSYKNTVNEKKIFGYMHSSKILGDRIHLLEEELTDIKKSKAYKITMAAKKVRNR